MGLVQQNQHISALRDAESVYGDALKWERHSGSSTSIEKCNASRPLLTWENMTAGV